MYINTLTLQFSQDNDFWRSVRIYSLGQIYSALKENPVITCGVLGFCACIVQPRLRLEIYSPPKTWLIQTPKYIKTIPPTQMQNRNRRVYKLVHQRTHIVPVITIASEKFHGLLSFVLL